MLVCHKSADVNCIQVVSLGIAETSEGQRHVGIIYRKDNQVRVCHLAWHCKLIDELASETAHFKFDWVRIAIPDAPLRAVVSFIELITGSNTGSEIPYSFLGQTQPFDRVTGKYNPSVHAGDGLTCATFILEIFKCLGLELLDESSFEERPDDLDWQNKITYWLRQRNVEGHHVAKLEESNLAKRFRPEEVAAASGEENLPLQFTEAASKGVALVEELHNCCPFTEDRARHR